MCSVSFSGKRTSGSRISASRSDFLEVLITKIVVRYLQLGIAGPTTKNAFLFKGNTRGRVLSAGSERWGNWSNSPVGNRRRWVVTEIYLTATVNAFTLWANIKYRIRFPLPSCVLNFCSIFILPCTHFDGTNPRNYLVHQRYASVWHCCCAQAQCSTNKGEPSEIRDKKAQETESHQRLPANQIDE